MYFPNLSKGNERIKYKIKIVPNDNKGENPLVCRNPGQDQISRAKKETQKAKAAAAAAQAEVNKNRKSKNKSCGYITYININQSY